MAKRRKQLVKDSGSAIHSIERKAGVKPKKVSKKTRKRIEKAGEIAIETNNFYRKTNSDLDGTDAKLF